MFDYTDRELKFLHKWAKEIADIKWEYEILKPEIINNGEINDAEIYVKIITDYGYHKFRLGITVGVLKFCTQEDLFEEKNKHGRFYNLWKKLSKKLSIK